MMNAVIDSQSIFFLSDFYRDIDLECFRAVIKDFFSVDGERIKFSFFNICVVLSFVLDVVQKVLMALDEREEFKRTLCGFCGILYATIPALSRKKLSSGGRDRTRHNNLRCSSCHS